MKLCFNLQEVIECYGIENLIPITNIKQILFYSKCGVQPKWIDESSENQGRIVAYYLKSESLFAFKKWMDNRPCGGVSS